MSKQVTKTDKSKAGKDSVTLLSDGVKHAEKGQEGFDLEINDGTFTWDEFIKEVVGEKYKCIQEFFDDAGERGMNFLYNLLELIRNQDEKINFARVVYILSRLEPDKKDQALEKEKYQKFSQNMYKWIREAGTKYMGKDARQLKVAMNMYSYMRRDRYNKEDGGIE